MIDLVRLQWRDDSYDQLEKEEEDETGTTIIHKASTNSLWISTRLFVFQTSIQWRLRGGSIFFFLLLTTFFFFLNRTLVQV